MQEDTALIAVPAWLWLWLPAVYLPLLALVRAGMPFEAYAALFEGESGLTELATAVLLVPAAVLALRQARHVWRGRAYPAAALLTLLGLGCVFLMLEEISYGQHIFGWRSPDYFQQYNAQRETNLHNLSYFNKNLAKWFLLSSMLIICAVLPPLFRSFGPPPWVSRSPLFGPLLPVTLICFPTAVIAMVTHVAVKILHRNWGVDFEDLAQVNVREVTELYIAFLLFLYALALRRGHAAANRAPAGSATRRRQSAV